MSDSLASKAAQLAEYLRELEQWLAAPADGPFSGAMQRAIERMIHLIVECAADAGDLWLAERDLEVGESAARVFRNLREAGLIDAKLEQSLRRAVSARNRIVHDYDRVRPDQARRDAAALLEDGRELLRRLLA